MDIKQLADQIASMTSEDRQVISNLLAKKPKRVFTPWRPRIGEDYYYIIACGVNVAKWDSGMFAVDCWRLADNNVFQTHELARRAAEKKQTRNALLLEIREYMDEIGCEIVPHWDYHAKPDGNKVYAICYYNLYDCRWELNSHRSGKFYSCLPYFAYDRDKCAMILDKFGDRLDILLEDK